jgi:hypothetical protein
MTASQAPASGPLSVWWKIAAIVTMVFGFTILIGLTVQAYRTAPPIPVRAIERGGAVIFTSDDVVAGQQVFLKHGLMANGTIWGHGAYLGPDFSAQYLHNWALDVADHAAQARFRRPYGELAPGERGEIDGSVARAMKENRYEPSTGTLTLSSTDADSFKRLRRTADLPRDRNDRRPSRRVFRFMIQHHPHRAATHFRRKLVRRLARHGSTFSGLGADKPGAVQCMRPPRATAQPNQTLRSNSLAIGWMC